ncbi:hypothetical protein L3X38_044564 [Prunus dulcis]|uniref:RNase H type-1 domain-containing protein n=1 Tax=Prunus dulcis TaxID=3755 RepID=A0AAD4V002_PRUDU|nr:hypothetical protein L3X38_044564 [Prunus dulcis]
MWNGSGKSASGLIGAGGVIRDSSGVWIAGFAVNLGQGQILEVEQIGTLNCHPLAVLVDSCCVLMRRIGNCHLVHVYRE